MRELYIELNKLYAAVAESAFRASPNTTTAQCLAAAIALRAYCVGGIHLGDAPHGTVMPHFTMKPSSNLTDGVMALTHREGNIITFTIWTGRYGLDAGLQQLANVKLVFDNQLPAFSTGGGLILNVRKTSGVWFELPEPEGGYGIPLDYAMKYR